MSEWVKNMHKDRSIKPAYQTSSPVTISYNVIPTLSGVFNEAS